MEPESNSDSEEKKDTLQELQIDKAMNEKGKGKNPMDSAIVSGVEIITQKAKGIVLDEAKVLKSDTDIEPIAAKSKGKAAASADSKTNKGKQMENVVKSCYSLRSGPKGMDIDVKPTTALAGKKRKGEPISKFILGTPGNCKTTGKRRHSDDDTDDKDGSGARTTRSSSKKMKVNSV